MKKTNLTILGLAGLIAACSHNKPAPAPPVEPVVTEDHARVDTTKTSTTMNAELEEYRMRMKNRIDELENNIAERRAQQKAEKNVKKNKEYNVEIERKEKMRDEFKQKMDNFETRAKEGWENFKAELDDLFNRDKNETDKDKSTK